MVMKQMLDVRNLLQTQLSISGVGKYTSPKTTPTPHPQGTSSCSERADDCNAMETGAATPARVPATKEAKKQRISFVEEDDDAIVVVEAAADS